MTDSTWTQGNMATPRQKSALIGLAYHHCPGVTAHSSVEDVAAAIESATGIAFDWAMLDRRTASQLISKLTK